MTKTETVTIPLPLPTQIALPEFLSLAIIKLEVEAQKLREAQLRLLAMHLKAEGIDGEWTLSPDRTGALHIPPPQSPPAE